MDKTQNTGSLSFLAKWARKVIVCNAHKSPECCSTPRNKIREVYMQDEYIPTPTTAFKCTKGRRLNFWDPKLLDDQSDVSEDESDFAKERTPKRGGISFQSIGHIFWSGQGLVWSSRRKAEKLHEKMRSSRPMNDGV